MRLSCLGGGLLAAGRKARSQRPDFFKTGIVAHLNGDGALFHHIHQRIRRCIFFQSGSKSAAADLYIHLHFAVFLLNLPIFHVP